MNIIFRRNFVPIAHVKYYLLNFIQLNTIASLHKKKMSTQILTKKINLENNLGEHILIEDGISQIFPDTKIHAISVNYDENPSNNKSILKNTMTRGLAEAIFHAYNNHQHLRLTPDDIWLTIAQGVSHHINYDAEKFRSRFVNHEVHRNFRLKGNWPEVVNRLVVKTDQAVEKIDIKSLLECNFSTTSKTSLTASRIVLLDMVTLEGTLEDWTKLQEKVIRLRQLDLKMDFWLDRLEPVIWKLVETYKGEVDETFWAKIISLQDYGSGGQTIVNGWITAFYPYSKDGTKLENNFIKPYDIPDGRVAVPFTTNTGLNLKFVAGFFGVQQKTLDNSNEIAVSPIIGWN
ncbi:hypothetical protein C1645_747329 [Glomus cerebriforme]|uniref:Uncharacterized protein n=1 Tax=Glomus cerebriforme TaxID=658196 RepID=A0A397TMM9_9GLOM|nr:hypothetical protein C1645_747329 [Glomus cerebriforme]